MQKYTAIILASRDIGEFDRFYIFYTKEAGLIKAVGKGARKPTARLAGHLEPLTLSEVYVARSRGRGKIASAITLDSFENIRKDFEKLREALKIFGFLSKNFSEEEKDERIFSLLEEFFKFFDRGNRDNRGLILVESFWWKLLDYLGQRPEVMKCVRCGANLRDREQKFFGATRGGVFCQKCAKGEREKLEISTNQIKLLRIFLANPLDRVAKVKVSEKELAGLERIRDGFLRYNFS